MKNVLVIEDEQNVAAFIKKGLNEAGYHVFIAYDGDTGLDLIQQKQIDFILLDVILPGKNGVEIAKEIRSRGHSETPILMLTALGTTDNIVNGLDAGADDYLIKPFKFKELLARLRALERRKNFTVSPQAKLKIANLELDTDAKVVKRDKDEIKLTSTEYRLLEYFMKNPNKVLSRIEILESVWDIGFDIGTNVVDVYVNYLRNKIDKEYSPKLIQTVIGMGYILKEDYENT
ncbi:response regulator transcription factor [Imtechella halotolerans]|uniref:Two-component system response regulator n=1 Tax=Imtechella halotolerans K1 TaxID=946077 RepID=I0WJN5_9FLAO|nr:response regulator transcription factor [Imtechella halotolerans]EID76601.1 two-component system response regulator [Imtechella halotolerans K1]WMQ62829.1 response regulator transcription factor [Imtechella halotolerans]